MLHVFRESVGRYVAIAILGLIAVTFIFFGIDFTIVQTNFAAKVNGEDIPLVDFERELQAMQNQYQQLYRLELTDDMRRELRRTVVEQMIMREVLRQRSDDAGYRVSNERLAEAIRETPAFQVDGAFSRDAYNARLGTQGLTPAMYEAMQREQLELLELQSAMAASTFLTPAEFRRYIELYNERRQIAYASFAVEDFIEQVEISDEAVAEHHAANQSRYMTLETVDLEYIELSQASVAETVEIDESDLIEYYEAERERFETTEERRARHILINVDGDDYAAAEAEAAEVLDRLAAGEQFETLASELSDDAGTRNQGGDLGWIGRGMLVGPFEDALYAMEVGEIEGPVETEFGYHILRLDDVRRGDVQPFEAVRDDLFEELSSEQAIGLFYDRANELADAAFDAYEDLQPAAEATGLPLQRIDGFSRAGDPERFPNSAAVVNAAFDEEAIVSGRNSGLLELSDEDVVVIRVVAHHPSEPQPLEAVADEIRGELARAEARTLARAAADTLLGSLREDATAAEALAAEQGATWVASHWVARNATDDPPELIAAAFARPRPTGDQPMMQRVPLADAEAVLVFTSVQPGEPEAVASEEREQRREQLAGVAADIEMEAYARELRERAAVRVPEEVLEPQL